MKKRILAALLALCLLPCVFIGCGNKEKDVHVFYFTYSDTYISTVRTALDQRLEGAGLSYQDYDAAGNQTTQTEQIRTAITKGAKVILVNLVNTGSGDAASEIVGLARDAGVAVIFFNREVSDEVIKSYDRCAFVGTRAAEAGILQGEMIGDYLVENFERVDLNKDGKISYILFKGEEGNNEAIFRTKHAVESADAKLAAAGKSALSFYDPSNTNKYLVDQNGQWSAAAANDYMTTALASHNAGNNNMIELVICNSDSMAEGAISALNVAGYNKGGESVAIPVFGVDASEAAKSLIKDGKMAGTVMQNADGMAEALVKLTQNSLSESGNPMDSVEGLTVDEDVSKVRIAYAKYVG